MRPLLARCETAPTQEEKRVYVFSEETLRGWPPNRVNRCQALFLFFPTVFPLPPPQQQVIMVLSPGNRLGSPHPERADKPQHSCPPGHSSILQSIPWRAGREGERKKTLGALDIWPGIPQTTDKLLPALIKSEAP